MWKSANENRGNECRVCSKIRIPRLIGTPIVTPTHFIPVSEVLSLSHFHEAWLSRERVRVGRLVASFPSIIACCFQSQGSSNRPKNESTGERCEVSWVCGMLGACVNHLSSQPSQMLRLGIYNHPNLSQHSNRRTTS